MLRFQVLFLQLLLNSWINLLAFEVVAVITVGDTELVLVGLPVPKPSCRGFVQDALRHADFRRK
ncbi:hypothetical protein D3C84_1085160 [compost metagenome]